MENSIDLLAIVLFIWFWVSCFIFKFLSDKIILKDKLLKRICEKNNELSKECLDLEKSNEELIIANYKLTSKK